jgi:uncharacterized membrane protein YphA (DoxX/SURF4 family)
MSGPSTDCPLPTRSLRPVGRWLGLLLEPVGRYIVAAVFLMAALTKFADLPGFRDRLVLHSGLPYLLALTAAHAIPSLELTCGFCLLLGVARREAAVTTAVLLSLFLVFAPWAEGATDCGCLLFPASVPWTPSGWQARLGDLALLLISVALACRGLTRSCARTGLLTTAPLGPENTA